MYCKAELSLDTVHKLNKFYS